LMTGMTHLAIGLFFVASTISSATRGTEGPTAQWRAFRAPVHDLSRP
jgi:hypothetical protein